MHSISKAFLLAMLCLMVNNALSALVIQAKVLRQDGRPIPGAIITDGKRVVRSSADGSFAITVTSDSLWFSCLGYFPQSYAIDDLPAQIILEGDPVELDKITVTEKFSGEFFSSIDRYLLRLDPDRSYQSASEIVSSISGFHSSDLSLMGERHTISLLGNLSKHTLIMLDGIPLNAQGEAFDISKINSDNIDRIEVIKNNASVYGGSSAIGGIVNIVTKQASGSLRQNVSFKQESGSYGYLKNSFRLANSASDFSYQISLTGQKADNNFSYKLPNWWNPDSLVSYERQNNKKEQYNFTAGLGSRIKDIAINYNADFESFKKELPGPVNALEIYQNAFVSGLSWRNNLRLEYIYEPLTFKTLAWINSDATLYDNTRAPLPVFIAKYRQMLDTRGLKSLAIIDILQLIANREPDQSNKTSIISELSAEAIDTHYKNKNEINTGNSIDKKVFQNALSSKNTLHIDYGLYASILSFASRYDKTGEQENFTHRGELLLKYYGAIDVSFGSTYGSSFSLPSIYDLYWRGDAQAIGNPDLEPEESIGYQMWIETVYAPHRFKLTYHDSRIKNMIQWQQVSMNGPAWKPFNISKARLQNIEAELFTAITSWLDFNANILFTEAKNLSEDAGGIPLDKYLIYTPKTKIYGKADFKHKDLVYWIRFNHTGKQFSTRDNMIDPLKAYNNVDTGVLCSVKWNGWSMTPYLNLYNVFSTRYEILSYVPQPGINWISGISLEHVF